MNVPDNPMQLFLIPRGSVPDIRRRASIVSVIHRLAGIWRSQFGAVFPITRRFF